MLSDKHNIEKEQNAQLRNQVAQLLQVEQEQKMQLQLRDSTIQSLQVSPKYTLDFSSSYCLYCLSSSITIIRYKIKVVHNVS